MLEEEMVGAIDGKRFIGWKEFLVINWNIQKNRINQYIETLSDRS